MPSPVEVSYRNVDASEALTAEIEAKVAKLEERFDRIHFCRVIVEAPHQRHHHGNLFRVKIHLQVPSRELIVDHESHDKHQHEDPYVAVRDAFDAMRRQLDDYVHQLHGDVKTHVRAADGRLSGIELSQEPASVDEHSGSESMPDRLPQDSSQTKGDCDE